MDDDLNSETPRTAVPPVSFTSAHDHTRVRDLREQAARCRRLCSSVLDPRTQDSLKSMAREYDAEADRLERGE